MSEQTESSQSPPPTHDDWIERHTEAAREKRDQRYCQACRSMPATKSYPCYSRDGRQIGEEVRCDQCQQRFEEDHAFRTRVNLRFRDRMRYLNWERARRTTDDFGDLNETIARLIDCYDGIEGVINHAYVMLHRKDTPVIWQRRIMAALINMITLREKHQAELAKKTRTATEVGRWLTTVKPEEVLEFLDPLMHQMIDSRMDLIVEYLRTHGWTLIPPWEVEPIVADGVASPYYEGKSISTPVHAERHLSFRESTPPESRS